jgi:hypothetical protein
MILYREDQSVYSTRLNEYFANKEVLVEFMGGVVPTTSEMLNTVVGTRDQDKLGEVICTLDENGYNGESIAFTPSQDGVITWVKVSRTDDPDTILCTEFVSNIESGNILLDKLETSTDTDEDSNPIQNTVTGIYFKFN